MATGSIKGKRPSSGSRPAASKNFSFKGMGADVKTREAGVVGYVGELPPEGAYIVTLKRLNVEQWTNSLGLRMLFEISEPKGSPREQYNGYGSWGGQGITDQSAGYINQFLKAVWTDEPDIVDYFWDNGVRTKTIPGKNGRKDTNVVTSIGGEVPVAKVSADGKVEMVEELKLVITVKHESFVDKQTKKKTVNARPQNYIRLEDSKLSTETDADEDPDEAFVDEDETSEDVYDEAEESEQEDADSDEGVEDEAEAEDEESEGESNEDDFYDEGNEE